MPNCTSLRGAKRRSNPALALRALDCFASLAMTGENMTHHHLQASPETCHWGFFEAKLKPVLSVRSGDEVTVDTISGGPDVVPDKSKFHVPPELAEVHAKNERMVPGQ